LKTWHHHESLCDRAPDTAVPSCCKIWYQWK